MQNRIRRNFCSSLYKCRLYILLLFQAKRQVWYRYTVRVLAISLELVEDHSKMSQGMLYVLKAYSVNQVLCVERNNGKFFDVLEHLSFVV